MIQLAVEKAIQLTHASVGKNASQFNVIHATFKSMNTDLILENIGQHIPLSMDEKKLFISMLEPASLAKKELLIRAGEICRHDYFINKGCVKVFYYDEKGTESVIKFALENWWVVDLDSFINHKPSFYFIQALEDTELWQLSKQSYDRLHREIPQFQQFSNNRWQQGFIALQHRLIQNLSLTAEQRYEHFKLKYPTLEQRIPLKLIAAYLGITPEFLSMLRKKWSTRLS